MKSPVYYYIAIFLFVIWFMMYMFLNAGAAVHLIFFGAVVVLVGKIFQDLKE